MEKALAQDKNIAVNATLEIIRDVYYLSQCTTLIGAASSQVFRMAVALANVTGVLHTARSLETREMVKEVQRLSDQYGVPFPESL